MQTRSADPWSYWRIYGLDGILKMYIRPIEGMYELILVQPLVGSILTLPGVEQVERLLLEFHQGDPTLYVRQYHRSELSEAKKVYDEYDDAFIYYEPTSNAEGHKKKWPTDSTDSKAVRLIEVPNLAHNQLYVEGYIDDLGLNAIIYKLNQGMPEWRELYSKRAIINDPRLVAELINYLKSRKISYQYFRSHAIA